MISKINGLAFHSRQNRGHESLKPVVNHVLSAINERVKQRRTVSITYVKRIVNDRVQDAESQIEKAVESV